MKNILSFCSRLFCTKFTPGESKLMDALKQAFSEKSEFIVKDISGGCGAMYEVHVSTIDFKGKTLLQQHQLVNKALSKEISSMHGLRINTTVPEL